MSSTVLVYKALEEYGQTATPHGRRAIAILLFQDVMLVPLVLLIPMLTLSGAQPTTATWLLLAAKSVLLVLAVLAMQRLVTRWLVPVLAELRSTELVVLFALTMLGGAGLGAYAIGLPPALVRVCRGLGSQRQSLDRADGRLGAALPRDLRGRLLRQSRHTHAIGRSVESSTRLPRRIGWHCFAQNNRGRDCVLRDWLCAGKWPAAWGWAWRLGEFSFLLLSIGLSAKLIEPLHFQVMLFLALGTLILTPQLIQTGLRWADARFDQEIEGAAAPGPTPAGRATCPRDWPGPDRHSGGLAARDQWRRCLPRRFEPRQSASLCARGLSHRGGRRLRGRSPALRRHRAMFTGGCHRAPRRDCATSGPHRPPAGHWLHYLGSLPLSVERGRGDEGRGCRRGGRRV